MKIVKTYSPRTKILSLILSFLIIFYLVPSSVFAEALESDTAVLDNSVSENEKNITYTPEIYEVTELREENVKHFRLADGSYVAAQYNYPVHYTGENGEFTDINNRLEEGTGGEYSNSNSRVSFVKKITGSGKLFTFAEDDAKISMSVLNANKGIYGSVANCEDAEEHTELQKIMNLENLSSKILYENVFDGVDIEYVVQSLDVKENIIVKEKSNEYTYSFEIKLKNLTPTLTDSGSVLIIDNEGNTKYVIPAPVVYDAAYEYAGEGTAYYSLEGENNKYTLTIVVDSSWMNLESTLFPVTVDPTIVTISEDGSEQQIQSHFKVTLSKPTDIRLLNIPTLPDNTYISSAFFTLAYKGSAGFFVPRLVLSDKATGAIYDIDNRSGPNLYIWEVTELIRLLQEESLNFRDLAISQLDPMDTLGLNASILLAPPASDLLTINAPMLELNYALSSGIEDHYAYSSHALVNAGVGSVNLATGNLTFVAELTSSTDYIMPITISAVYNSSMSGKDYTITNSYSAYGSSFMPYGFKLNISETIVNNEIGGDDTIKTRGYILSDADGTEHIFYKYTLGYYDDSGLGRTLSVGTDTITISNKDRSRKTFSKMSTDPEGTNGGWVLSKITDPVGNSMIIELDENNGYRPIKISLLPKGHDTAIDLIEFYYTNGKLIEIRNLGNNDTVVLSYSFMYNGLSISPYGYYLRKIDYCANRDDSTSNKTSTLYDYHFTGKLQSVGDTLSGQSLHYSWSGNKLTSVVQMSSESEGQTVKYKYGIGHADIITSGNDENILIEDDNIKTRYIFDNLARAVSVYSFSGDGSQIYGATNGKYETQPSAKNSLKESANLGGNAVNYLLNGSFEFKTYSRISYWDTSNLSISQSSNHSATGSFCLEVSPEISGEGILSQNVYLENGEYNLSINYAMSNAADVNMYLRIKGSDGTEIAKKQLSIDKVDTRVGFAFANLSFEIDYVNSVTVEIIIEASSNTSILIDDIMLAKGIGVAEYSIIQAGNFESSHVNSSYTLEDVTRALWKDESGGNIILSHTEDPFSRVAWVSNSSIKQVVYDSGTGLEANFTYKISGFANTRSLTGSGNFRLVVNVFYDQYNSADDECITYYFDFAKVTNEWVYVSELFSGIPDEADKKEGKNYSKVTKIEVFCEYSNQDNGAFAYFDNISLTDYSDSSVVQYAYDERGNLIAEKSLYNTVAYTYDNYDRIVLMKNSKGEACQYTYYSNGLPYKETYLNARSNDNGELTYDTIYTTTYTYNSYGQLISTKTESADNQIISSSSVYDVSTNLEELENRKEFFGALLESTDTLSITTKYFYRDSDGRLSATLTEGDGVAYSYDAMGRLTGVVPAIANGDSFAPQNDVENVVYAYEEHANGDLSSITTDSTNYVFSYDEFGNVEEIAIGDQTLASYEYNDYNGKLIKIIYGNGFSVEYVYNSLELLEKACYTYDDGTLETIAEYTYTRDGQLHSIRDLKNNSTTVYEYDSSGRLIGSYSYSETNYATDLSSGIVYDTDDGRICSISHKWKYPSGASEKNILSIYEYDYYQDGAISTLKIASGAVSMEIQYLYDYLKRLGTIEYNQSEGLDIRDEYLYYEVDGNATGLIEEHRNTIGSSSTTYNYTYDSKGNITKIVIGDKEIRYSYDELNQLVREDNELLNETYTYSYDNAGNITSRKTYALTAEHSTPSSPTSLNSYSYNDATWGDLLTSYNGHSITYDEIGNPLTYYNGSAYTFTWEGRRLVGAVMGSNVLSFTYNDEGIRISKTNSYGYSTEYILNGTQILGEITNSHMLVYIYDGNNSPIGMMYRKNSYSAGVWDIFWFGRNLQGDIVAVYDNEGEQLITYTYDAWGNFKEHYLHSGVGYSGAQYNPFRYRGYYYDTDLGMYYLQSRYYDPNTCRFISPDTSAVLTATPMALTDKNLYAYCDNNPVMRVDEDGEFWGTAFVIGATVGLVVGVAGQVVSDLITSAINKKMAFSSWQTYVGAAVGGALGGAILGVTGNVAAANAASGFITTGVGLTLEKVFPGDSSEILEKSWIEVGTNAIIDGAISYGLGLLPGFNKITQGRNSMSAVYKSGLTKLRNNTVSKMSMKVATKGIASVFVGSLAMDCYYGLKQVGYERIKRLINEYAR